MKKALLLLTFVFFILNLFSQDVVYLKNNNGKDNWFKVSDSDTTYTFYEHEGILFGSKVLFVTGNVKGFNVGVEYDNYMFNSDTVIYEFKTDKKINIYHFESVYNNDEMYHYLSLRKSDIGTSTLDGKYMLIAPIINQTINVFDGIGNEKIFYRTFKSDSVSISEYLYLDDKLSNRVTLEIISSAGLNVMKPKELLHINDVNYSKIKIKPTRVENLFTVEIPNNVGVIIKIYNTINQSFYTENFNTEINEINISILESGLYFVVIIDEKYGNILISKKIIKL